jgi:hypothetical protein
MGGRIFYTGDVKEFKLYSKQDVERVVSSSFLLSLLLAPHSLLALPDVQMVSALHLGLALHL